MRQTEIKPSVRLLRAAAAERADIARQCARLHTRRERLIAQVEEIDASLAALDERATLLRRLAPTSETASPPAPVVESAETVQPHQLRHPPSRVQRDATAPGDTSGRKTLRGPAIREIAVSLLATRRDAESLHYRAWFDLLTSAGYQVAGKDPLAVFLTQLSRSPLIRKSTKTGVYEIDRDAPRRLVRQLAGLQTKLRETTNDPSADLGEIRSRREDLVNAIRRTERALDEAERVLGSGTSLVAVAAPARAAG
jgi:hypothetical protein